MAGPTVNDLVALADELAATDELYLLRGTGAGADRKTTGDRVIPTILTQNTTTAINLNSYKGDFVIFSTPAANITLTFSNMLPNGRKIIIVNKSSSFDITCAGTFVEVVAPNTSIHRVSDATSFYDLQIEGQGYDLVINSQAEFEHYFGTGDDTGIGTTGATGGGWVCVDVANDETVTIPANISILLKSNPDDGVTGHFKYNATNYPWEAYELNTRVKLSTGVTIHGEGIDQTIIARNSTDNYPMFITDYLEQEAVTGVATNDFTVASSANFQPGQTIEHSNDNAFYKVISVPDGTSVLVDRTITGAAAGNISVCQDNIELKNFTFDGKCNIDGLGGTRTNQAFYLQYCAHSNFELKVINCKDTNGGAYDGNDLVFQLKIQNIFHCEATGEGGACYQCSRSDISNIHDCSAISGGALSNCDYSIISNIYGCTCTNNAGNASGGACYQCTYCTISNIYGCSCIQTANPALGGACYACNYSTIRDIFNCVCTSTVGHSRGGACYQCSYCTISNIEGCSCTSTTGNSEGGACYSGSNNTISDIDACSCETTTGDAHGGACYATHYCSINRIDNCTTEVTLTSANTAEGGGCYGCDNCTISDISGCTANSFDNDSLGGACAECGVNGNETIYLGSFAANTDDTGGAPSRDTISNGFGLTLLQYDGTTSSIAAEGAVDLD